MEQATRSREALYGMSRAMADCSDATSDTSQAAGWLGEARMADLHTHKRSAGCGVGEVGATSAMHACAKTLQYRASQ